MVSLNTYEEKIQHRYGIFNPNFFFYSNVVQKLKLNKINTTVPRQQHCVLTGENKSPIQ